MSRLDDKRPLPVNVLLDSKQDTIHRDPGAVRAARSVKVTTRAEMVEACDQASRLREYRVLQPRMGDAGMPPASVMAARLREAAATLTRDGELRERLKNLVETWRHRAPYNEQCYANRLSELLKETSDEGK